MKVRGNLTFNPESDLAVCDTLVRGKQQICSMLGGMWILLMLLALIVQGGCAMVVTHTGLTREQEKQKDWQDICDDMDKEIVPKMAHRAGETKRKILKGIALVRKLKPNFPILGVHFEDGSATLSLRGQREVDQSYDHAQRWAAREGRSLRTIYIAGYSRTYEPGGSHISLAYTRAGKVTKYLTQSHPDFVNLLEVRATGIHENWCVVDSGSAAVIQYLK